MNIYSPGKIVAALLLLIPLMFLLPGCGCGFDCNNANDPNEPAFLTLGLSDSLPESLKQVVLEIDSVTLRRSGRDDVIIDRFTVADLNLSDVDTFPVDLLQYRGVSQLVVIEDMEIANGNYSSLSIGVIADDSDLSYVQESDDTIRRLTVTGNQLNLPGINLTPGTHTFTVEFDLAQALQQLSEEEYRMLDNGIRIEDNTTAARLSGQVDSALFSAAPACEAKDQSTVGNRLYLYEGVDLTVENLSDVHTSNSSEDAPVDAIAPFAVATIENNTFTGNWEYVFGYLPTGSYTMAFSCNTQNDDAVEYDGLTIPLPAEQLYEFTLTFDSPIVCNLDESVDC